MLAQSFLSADDLGILDMSREGLILVLGMLERGELTWTPYGIPRKHGFNMIPVWDEHECGSVGCIVGWAGFLTGVPVQHSSNASIAQRDSMSHLICPYTAPDRDGLTVAQAAHALRTYLVTGKAEWK